MDEVDIEDLTIEQYLRLTQESQIPKKIEDMTIAEYLEYEKTVNENHIGNTKSYLPTYLGKGTPTLDPIREFAHCFDPSQPGAESDYDSEDMEEEVEYMTNDELVMSEQEESNQGHTQNIQHFEEKDSVDEWLNEMKDGIMKRQFEASIASVSDEVSSIASNKVDRADDNTLNTAPCRLPKELSPGSFLLPFNINSHNLYALTTLDAKDNIMPLKVYEYLGLNKLRDTSTIENTTGTNEPLRTIDILVKFRTLEFLCNFVIKVADDVIILGRSFLEATHAQIDVFKEEISFELGSDKFELSINSHQCIEEIYMVNIGQEEETFNPLEIGIDLFSYESPACLEFKQRTRSYGTPNPQDEIAEPLSFSPDRRGLVKRWHVCKPVHVTYDDGNGKDCGMWPTCDPDSKFCFGYNEVFGVRYGQHKIDDTTWERWYYEWVAQNYEFSKHRTLTSTNLHDYPIPTPQGHQEQGDDEPRPIRPRPCNYSFEEWMNIRIGHNNLHESDREFIFNEWILDSYNVKEEYAREIGDPYSRRFDEYKRVFNNEIEHLSNEYILRIGKKGYVLDDVWEKCQQNYKKTNEAWHDEAYEEDEMWQIGDEKTNYDPPYNPEAKRRVSRPARLIIMWLCRNNYLNMECRVRRLRHNTFIGYAVIGSTPINRGLIQAIPTSLPPQPIGEATKASNLRRIPPGVQGRSHFTYFLYLIVQIRILRSDIDICKAFLKLCIVEDPIWEKISCELKEPIHNAHVEECVCCQVQHMMEESMYAIRKEMREIHMLINNNLKILTAIVEGIAIQDINEE
ncbi:phospholipase-like protein [Tanacetum coccineum]